MKTNILATALGVATLALLGLAPAQAQTAEEFASVTGGGNPPTFIYTGGAGGGLTLTSGNFDAQLDVPKVATQINNPAIVTFTGLQNLGAASTIPLGGITFFDQTLTGGMFTVTDAATNQLLLSGTFAGADLTGAVGSSQAGVNTDFKNVAYTGGSYASAAGITLNGTPKDSFNFSLINTTPNLSVSSGVLSSFTSAGNGQFTGEVPPAAVPEPATVVPFLFGGLGLLALAVRKTRKAAGVPA
jgi:hypothetical protein